MHTPNTDCLDGIKCPNCGSTALFSIQISSPVLFSDDGVYDFGNMDFTDESGCSCAACKHTATVAEFRGKGEPVAREAAVGPGGIDLSPRELAIVLAGLRHLQKHHVRNKAYPEHVVDILECADAENATLLEIDQLAEKMNMQPRACQDSQVKMKASTN